MESRKQIENLPIKFYIGDDVVRNEVTNMPLIIEKKTQSPEMYPSFWVTPRTKDAGNLIRVKRFSDGREDNIHILRINYDNSGSRFKFPSFFMCILISRMENILKRLVLDDDKTWKLNGLTEITTWNDLKTDSFWKGSEAVKILRFHLCPYISEYGTLKFRLWNEVADEFQKTYEKDGGFVSWRGPAISIGVSAFKGLLKALKELMAEKPETE